MKRFNHEYCCCDCLDMEENSEGEYVRYSDVEQLIQGIKEIRKHAELSNLDCSFLAWPLEIMSLCDNALQELDHE